MFGRGNGRSQAEPVVVAEGMAGVVAISPGGEVTGAERVGGKAAPVEFVAGAECVTGLATRGD